MKTVFSFYLLMLTLPLRAQELFPNSEPASTIGKNVLGLRSIWETYNELGRQRNQFSVRIMYGITKNLTVYVQPSVSNHHGVFLSGDFTSHSVSGGQIFSFTSPKVFGRYYPYRFGGIYGYAKYRFLSFDGDHQHFRMAGYAAYSTANVAHEEAEPNLIGDTGGFEAGLLSTLLRNHFAASLTTGFILPKNYNEVRVFDSVGTLTTNVAYGKSFNYGVSFGYLVYPKILTDFHQPNYSVYLELLGKSYAKASVIQNDAPVEIGSFTLYGGNYVDAHLSFQAIVNSNTRVDLGVELQLISRSWDHFYPLYTVGVQHYFYLRKKPEAGS